MKTLAVLALALLPVVSLADVILEDPPKAKPKPRPRPKPVVTETVTTTTAPTTTVATTTTAAPATTTTVAPAPAPAPSPTPTPAPVQAAAVPERRTKWPAAFLGFGTAGLILVIALAARRRHTRAE